MGLQQSVRLQEVINVEFQWGHRRGHSLVSVYGTCSLTEGVRKRGFDSA